MIIKGEISKVTVMMHLKKLRHFGALVLGLVCSMSTYAENPSQDSLQNPGQESMYKIMEDYFEASLKLNSNPAIFQGDYRFNDRYVNDLTDEYMQKRHELNTHYLKLMKEIDQNTLLAEDQNSYNLFVWDRQLDLEQEKFSADLLPLNQFYSIPNSFAQLGSGEGAQPFKTPQDYDNFLKKMDGFVDWMDSAKLKMNQGIKQQIVLPAALVKKIIPQLKAMLVNHVTDSIFWVPIKNMPVSIQGEEKRRITQAYKIAILEKLLPAYQGLYAFVKNVYLPKARDTSGYSSLKNGDAWYQWFIDHETTTKGMSADQIHQIGLDEVARIHREMLDVKEKLGFKGSLQEFFESLQTEKKYYFETADAVMERYQQQRKFVAAVIPNFFNLQPKSNFEIRPVEAFRAESAAGASYEQGTPDGSRPGVFYINTFNLLAQPKFGVVTLYLHEAVPGHHFQISIAQELTHLPKYQRFSIYNAYVEGWALYSESIGKEMGLFDDPLQYYGRLSDELLRAMRLVVDTGLHAKKWSKEQAQEYMLKNSSMALSDVVSEVERYMAIPGQALSYKIGQLKITGLRHWAQKELGDKFELKQFHDQVLGSGALPMAVLENKIHHWVKSFE